jgi:hypothetical protein
MSNSPSGALVISLHHRLLTASAHLRHRSRMQCNAGVRKTAQLHFRIQVTEVLVRSAADRLRRNTWLGAPSVQVLVRRAYRR